MHLGLNSKGLHGFLCAPGAALGLFSGRRGGDFLEAARFVSAPRPPMKFPRSLPIESQNTSALISAGLSVSFCQLHGTEGEVRGSQRAAATLSVDAGVASNHKFACEDMFKLNVHHPIATTTSE